jgi:prepilin-type processing-associated H-X9-DG protein
MTAKRFPAREGHGLVELCVVLGLIGLLMGLILQAIQSVREAASRTACLVNMQQMGVALHAYHGDHGRFPPVGMTFPPAAGYRSGALVSWRVPLLPYLEQEPVWLEALQACRQDPYSYRNPPHTGMAKVIRSYACPSDGRLAQPLTDPVTGITAAYTSYLGVAGLIRVPGVFSTNLPRGDGTRLADITDGTSNTLAVGERPPPGDLFVGWWYSMVCDPALANGNCRGPATALVAEYPHPFTYGCGNGGPIEYGPGRLDNPCDRHHFWSLHPGGANFLFADGSVRTIRYEARHLMKALATRAGGEAVEGPE